jgi:hypothetical protein
MIGAGDERCDLEWSSNPGNTRRISAWAARETATAIPNLRSGPSEK